MAPAPTAAVTAQGIRDGDRVAMGALVARRGTAVLAYCERVAAPGRALEAAGEAFARFRREVVAAPEPRALDPEALLLRGTRRAAAARALRPAEARGTLARRRGATCALVPELLAARAEGDLTAADRMRLSRHLERCEECRAAETRFAEGERAYHDAPDVPPPDPAAGGLVAALRAAAPNADERREPARPAPAGAVVNGNGRAMTDEPTGALAATERAAPAAAEPPTQREEPPEPPDLPHAPTLSWDPADLAAVTAAAERRPSWPVVATRIVVPALVLVAAVVAALAVAGVFTGGDGRGSAGSIETEAVLPASTVHVPRRALTTPLPARGEKPPSRPRKRSAAPSPTPTQAPPPPTSSPSATPTPPAAAAQPPQTETATREKTRLDARARRKSESAAPPFDGGAPAGDEPGFQPQTTPTQP